MAKKNKHHPPSSPAAAPAASHKRRRISPADDAPSSAATPPAQVPNRSSKPPPFATAAAPGSAAAPPACPAGVTIHIAAGSKIQAKVRAALAALGPAPTKRSSSSSDSPEGSSAGGAVQHPLPHSAPASQPGANGVVLLEARAPAASKLISVGEITKRTLDCTGRAWWAYAGVRGVLEESENVSKAAARKGGDHAKETGEEQQNGNEDCEKQGEEDEDAFEPLKWDGGARDGKKVRNVPILTVYLAIKPVPTLKALYGEQRSHA